MMVLLYLVLAIFLFVLYLLVGYIINDFILGIQGDKPLSWDWVNHYIHEWTKNSPHCTAYKLWGERVFDIFWPIRVVVDLLWLLKYQTFG
jgi:hypothetical protein